MSLFLHFISPKWDTHNIVNFDALCHAPKQMVQFTLSEPLDLFFITFQHHKVTIEFNVHARNFTKNSVCISQIGNKLVTKN
jgi:hypothetical protein